jgi:hypothetical protein
MCTYREPTSITKKQYKRCRVTAQSTWKKSTAGIVAACACRNFRQVVSVSRLGAGGIFRALRIRRMADALTRWPTLSSSPWIILYPQPVVLGGEPFDDRGDLGADRRPSRPVRAGPLAGDQAVVPAQDGAGGYQPVRSRDADDQVVIALIGFDKKAIGDVFYASAAARGEALVDAWLRQKGNPDDRRR